jgi:glycerate kinase
VSARRDPVVVVAPDKFKGSLTAARVAAHVAAGLRAAVGGIEVREVPVADGGEGTVAAALAAGFHRVEVPVHGPTGRALRAGIAVRGDTAVVELAAASGLAVLPDGRPAPLAASSVGTGELVRAALDAGCRTVVLGIGGSAGTDGGAGLLVGLGARLLDRHGAELGPGGGELSRLDRVDLGGLDPRLATTSVILASDVDNPLLGPRGAAAVYGPQKGADPGQVAALEDGLRRWVRALGAALGAPAVAAADAEGAGAAGGVGYAALAALAARRQPGVEIVLRLTGLRERLAGASLVITGEGSLDAQTLHGKTAVGVAAEASRAGLPAVAVAGRSLLGADGLAAAGLAAAYPLTDIEPDPGRCMTDAGPLLERLAARVAADWLGTPGRAAPPDPSWRTARPARIEERT